MTALMLSAAEALQRMMQQRNVFSFVSPLLTLAAGRFHNLSYGVDILIQ